MKLMELEQQLGILFPKKFHEIYETGAMEWLEMNSEQIQKNRNDYLQDTKAFLMLNCDCEPYSFDEIPEATEPDEVITRYLPEKNNINMYRISVQK